MYLLLISLILAITSGNKIQNYNFQSIKNFRIQFLFINEKILFSNLFIGQKFIKYI